MNLCPHESNILIKDITQKIDHISLVRVLLGYFNEAIMFFQKRMLSRFDAQVGENLCQIRAYKVYQLSQSKTFHDKLITTQNNLKRSIKILISNEQDYQHWLKRNKADRPNNIQEPLYLSDFFEKMEVRITFEEDMFFLFLSYFLCKYCIVDEENIPFTMDYQRIQKDLNLSRSFSKRLVHYYQKHLSILSCDFIFKLLSDIKEYAKLNSVLRMLHKKAGEGRMVLPCFLVTKIILQHMIQKEVSILLVCNLKIGLRKELVTYMFQGNKLTNNFELSIFNSANNILVFYGEHKQPQDGNKEKFLEEILEIGFKEIIFYNNAAHPQFSGQMLLDFRDNPFHQLLREYKKGSINLSAAEMELIKELSNTIYNYKHNAIQFGCIKDRPRLFLLKHIFCDTTEHHSNRGIYGLI